MSASTTPRAAPGTTPGAAPVATARTTARAAPFRRDTPTLMRWLAVGLVVVGLVTGLVAAQSFRTAGTALERAGENAAQLVRVQAVQTALVRADADATNAFLVGGLEPAALREDYDEAVGTAGRGITLAARAQPADGEALATLTTAVQDYVGTVALARANNRQGLPVGAQYLRVAGSDLRADALPVLAVVRDANSERTEAELTRVRTAWVPPVVVGLLGLVAVVLASSWLARRTHRRLNLPLVASGVVLVAVTVGAAVVLGTAARTVADVRETSYAAERDLAEARTAAFDAKANESLTLVSRGSGAAFEEAWVAASDTTEARLADAAAADSAADGLAAAWTDYADRHREVRALDDGGDWEQAVALATSREPDSPNAAFDAFDERSAAALADLDARTAAALEEAGRGIGVAVWLCLLAGVAAAALAQWGLRLRYEEYR
ncbi:hypothetical protein [Aquipuribacter nitratireducens]|uniref:Secreted protein n=1 Tax=Aquipuribacter nitratireducens TaxID=650104 RepID=A0ABW0GJL1_9MICO